MVEVAGLRKAFRNRDDEVPVLEDVAFRVGSGCWTTLIGPSGCGKTTLLRILAGLLEQDAGDVRVEGARDRLGRSAFLPQHDTLLPWRTALDNAILAAEISGEGRGRARSEAKALFAQFGLSGFEFHYPSQLSGGMRQRLALVRTFLTHRRVVLLDEPLGALDPLTRTSLQDWLLHVWETWQASIVLVTHDVEEALYVSDRILLLSARPASVIGDVSLAALGRPRRRDDASFTRRRTDLLSTLLGGAFDDAAR